MLFITVPAWINRHLYEGKKFRELSREELEDLKRRLARFRPDRPEVSIVIPAWNEAENIFRALSSLADSNISLPAELVVVNNNSTDHTQEVLDDLGVVNYFQPMQGTPYARQLGLEMAKGKYHLCADSDSLYPPDWAETMIGPLRKDDHCVGVYGRYSFLPLTGKTRISLTIYELITGLLVRLRKRNREYINVLGFNMGFITEIGLRTGGFKVKDVRKFDNKIGSDYFVEEAEDGRMALNLMKEGKLKLVSDARARVFTSPRRLKAEGGLFTAFTNRFKLHSSRLMEYFRGN